MFNFFKIFLKPKMQKPKYQNVTYSMVFDAARYLGLVSSQVVDNKDFYSQCEKCYGTDRWNRALEMANNVFGDFK
jgi:hypothetical protein